MSILNILWESGPRTVRQVHDQLQLSRNTEYTTTLAQLQFMYKKGLVLRDDSQRSHRYRAARPRKQVERSVVRSLIDSSFAGSARSLVLHALAIRKASPEEIKRIDQLFDELEGQE